VAAPERFSILAPLPPQGDFRRALALDRGGAARAVVLAFVPPAVTDDPARLAAVLRDVEAAARLHHPGAAAVVGTETVGGELAVVEQHRSGATLRALLDAGGRLPGDVAVRIVLDACAALAQAHAIDAGEGHRLAHGALDAAAIVVGEDGAAFVCGLALGGGDPSSDVRALGAVLFECIAGERPAVPPLPLDAPGVSTSLAALLDRAVGASGAAFESAAALAAALAGAAAPASHAAVSAYADAILPPEEGERGTVRRALANAVVPGKAEEISEDLVVEPTDRALTAPAAPSHSGRASARATADAARMFPKPAPPARRSAIPTAVGAVCLAAGFAIGLAVSGANVAKSLRAAWTVPPWTVPPTATAPAMKSAHPERSAAAGGAESKGTPTPTATPTSTATSTKRVPPKRAAPPSRKLARERAEARSPGKGNLDVTAPDDAEVFLDGRLIGRGSVRREIPEGAHRIEVRRAGASAAEQFTLQPGETWTYTVTPAP